jgi:hypothetical protein
VWTESAFAFDNGCRLISESDAVLAQVIPLWAGRSEPISDETIRRWRKGGREVPFWALRGLWRRLRHDGWDVETLRSVLGFAFLD